MSSKALTWWCWIVSGFLVLGGAIGLFTNDIGPLPTNRIHAVGLNLGVGLVGFAFARFGAEPLFVLLSGLGMIVLATLGFLPATQPWLYTTLHMNRLESVFELVAGVVSLSLWVALRPRATLERPPSPRYRGAMRLAIVLAVVIGSATAHARDLGPRPLGPRLPPCATVDDPAVPCRGPTTKKVPPTKTIDITHALALDGRVHAISMLQFLERATEELERAALEKKSFVPKLVQSVDDEAL